MADTITHRHQSALPDTGADVSKNEWNDSHIFAGGVDGQYLKRDSGAPDGWSWVTPAVSGGLVLIEQHAASASASLNFTTTITSLYDEYAFELVNILPASAAQDLRCRVSVNAGVSYDSTANYYGAVRTDPNSGGSAVTQTNAATAAVVFPAVDNTASAGGVSGSVRLFNPLSAAIRKHFTLLLLGSRAADVAAAYGIMLWNVTTAVDAVQFYFASGNITSGTIRAYGVSK